MSGAAAAASGSAMEGTSSPASPVISAAGEPGAAGTPEKRKRPARPKIDIDAKITDLSKDIAAAQKLLKETKTLQRNERRKKQRLIKKASGLSSVDLERIAVIKRCGLWEPGQGVSFSFPPAGENAAAQAAAVPEAVADAALPVPRASAPPPAAAITAAGSDSDEEEAAHE